MMHSVLFTRNPKKPSKFEDGQGLLFSVRAPSIFNSSTVRSGTHERRETVLHIAYRTRNLYS